MSVTLRPVSHYPYLYLPRNPLCRFGPPKNFRELTKFFSRKIPINIRLVPVDWTKKEKKSLLMSVIVWLLDNKSETYIIISINKEQRTQIPHTNTCWNNTMFRYRFTVKGYNMVLCLKMTNEDTKNIIVKCASCHRIVYCFEFSCRYHYLRNTPTLKRCRRRLWSRCIIQYEPFRLLRSSK